jgi:hypothetical protein
MGKVEKGRLSDTIKKKQLMADVRRKSHSLCRRMLTYADVC